MPIYEYACNECHDEFELLIRGDEQPECPSCHAITVERRPSVAAAHSKGGQASLPLANLPRGGGCGKPQCGMGGCQGLM